MNIVKKTLPNLLTMMRIVMIPIIVITLYHNQEDLYYFIASIAFCSAGFTDFIDGYLARKWQVQSNLGKFLDPIADKLIIITTLIMLIHTNMIHHSSIFPSLAIICREILISGIREFMGNMNIEIPVTYMAKIKTTVQIIAINLLILSGCNILLPLHLQIFGEIALWIAAILTVYSGYNYLKVPIQHFKNGN